MIQRCTNSNYTYYKDYGGRGIKVCDRWLNSFEDFLADMREAPKGLSLDRIDNNGDYTPENCRWATIKEQCNNTRCNHLLTYNGKTQSISQWANELGTKWITLYKRINTYGWSVDRALSTPVQRS
jgi:hypothetical protein